MSSVFAFTFKFQFVKCWASLLSEIVYYETSEIVSENHIHIKTNRFYTCKNNYLINNTTSQSF